MKNALAVGDCDIVTANTRPLDERKKDVHFQCEFEYASNVSLDLPLAVSCHLLINAIFVNKIFLKRFVHIAQGWIRSGRDPQLVMNDVYYLNKTGILVGGKCMPNIIFLKR